MGISRIFALTDIVLRAHIFNPFWWSRERRSKRRRDVASVAIPNYLRRYLPAAAAVKETQVICDDENEKIFSFWHDGEENAPQMLKVCFKRIRKYMNRELIVVSNATLDQYTDLPPEIVAKYKAGKIRGAHFADIVRVELLYRYGGYWMDATNFPTDDFPSWITSQDFFVFMVGNVGQSYSFMQNCFIRARKGAYLLAAWRAMIIDFWMHESHSFDYFMHQMLFKTLVENDPRAIKYFAKMPKVPQDPTHRLWHNYKYKKFDMAEFKKLTKDSFFQKLSRHDRIVPGTYSEAILKM